MAKGKRQAYDEYQRVQRAAHRAEQEVGSHDGAHAHGEALAPPGMSVGDARLAGRGNGPVRIAAMQQIQRTQGNRAAQRLMRGGATPVQRQVRPVQRDLFGDIGEGISKGISSIGSAIGSAFDSVEEWLGGGDKKGGKSGDKKGAKKEHNFKKETYTLSDEDVTLVHAREETNKKGKVTEKGRSQISKSPAEYTAEILALKDIKASDWFSEFTRIKFLGTRFSAPIHIELASHLKDVEDKLLQQYGGEESDPDKKAEAVRNAVGLTTEAIKGGRDDPTSADLSMHLFGLAIDVNFEQNPYIGVSANPVFNRAGLLVENKPAKFVSGDKMDYDELVALNKVLTTYFSYIDNKAELEKRLAVVNETEWAVDGSKGKGKKKPVMKKWKGMTADDVVKIIQADLDSLAAKWRRSGAKDVIKAGGFTNLKKELVDGIDLAWGGSGYGDMMHFDLRNKGKGKQVHSAIVKYGKKQEKAAEDQYAEEHKAAAGAVPAQPYRVQRLVAGKDGRVVQRYRPSRFAASGNRAIQRSLQRSRAGSVSVQRADPPGGAVADKPTGASSLAAPKTVAEAMLIIKRVETDGGPRYPAVDEVQQLEEAIKLLEDTGRYTVDRTTYKVSFVQAAGTKIKVDTIEDFILFVETVERAYPAAPPEQIASEVRQMWFSDVNWELLVGSQGITEGSGGDKKYRDIETEAPIASMFDMKDLAPSKGTKVITTPMGPVTISHVMAGIDATLSGMAPKYPEGFLEDRERDVGGDHDTYDALASYNALKKASNGDPRDFTTWSGDLGQGYADYIIERWLKGTTSAKLEDFMKAKADDAALLADIHGYIAVEVWKNVPASQSPSRDLKSVSNFLRDFYLTDKKTALLGQDYLAYFEAAAKKTGADLRPFILDRILAFAGVWYAKGAVKHLGAWGSKGWSRAGIIENHITQFNQYHTDNETSEAAPNKVGTYIDKFMKVLGQKMP
jgi:hypothetical protein